MNMLFNKAEPFQLSKLSKARLSTCNEPIISAVKYLLQFIDVGVVCGHRGRVAQNEAFANKATKVKFPDSQHNKHPSDAIDLVVYVDGMGYINEKTAPQTYRQYYGYIAGILRAYCAEHNLLFRWGGDWDRDANFNDQKFNDLLHFEIYKMGVI